MDPHERLLALIIGTSLFFALAFALVEYYYYLKRKNADANATRPIPLGFHHKQTD